MPPTFIFKPQSKKVFEGDTARLECQISAIPTPRIYWKRNNEMVQYNTDRIRYPTDEFWWVGHWCVRKQQPVFAESNVNGLVSKSSRLESWICPPVWHRGHSTECWAGTVLRALLWGHRGRELCPGAPLGAAAVEGPWRSTALGMKCAVWGDTRWCHLQGAKMWITGGSNTNVHVWTVCSARVVLGLAQLLSMQTDSVFSPSPSKHLGINTFIFQLAPWQYWKDLPPDP